MANHIVNRNPAVAAMAKKRDGYCARCLQVSDLHAHHLTPLSEGGADALENIATLCRYCHREWHHYCEDVLDFATFLTVPSLRVLVAAFSNEAWGDKTISDISSAWLYACLHTRGAVHTRRESTSC